jgi:hypothetical protein
MRSQDRLQRGPLTAHPADTDGGPASLREPALTAAKAAAKMAKFVRMARPVPLFLANATIGAPRVASPPGRRDGTRMPAMRADSKPNLIFIAPSPMVKLIFYIKFATLAVTTRPQWIGKRGRFCA